MKSFVVTGIFVLLFAGCATNPGTVIPREGGEFHAIGKSAEKDTALESALKAAENCCRDRGKFYIVTKQEISYEGTVSEETRKTSEMVAGVAALTGNYIPSLAGEEDYRATVVFRCE